MANNAIDLAFVWDPAEPIAIRPLVLQKNGGYNLFYTHDMRPRRRRRVARRSVATEPRSGRKRPRNKNVSELVFFQQQNGIAAHYEYAPFGAVIATSRSTSVTAYDFREYNPFRFSSEYFDEALGLVYYNYRHYEPVAGRWTTRDPVEEAASVGLYDFCRNNTILYYDATEKVVPALIYGGAAIAKVATIEAALEAALASATATVAISIAGSLRRTECPAPKCLPCNPPVGTLMYQIHTTHCHAGMCPHIHYFVVSQSPPIA